MRLIPVKAQRSLVSEILAEGLVDHMSYEDQQAIINCLSPEERAILMAGMNPAQAIGLPKAVP